MRKIKRFAKLKKKMRRSMAYVLALGLALSASGCGKQEESTGHRVSSIFSLFEQQGEDPFEGATVHHSTEGGDTEVDPPDFGSTESTEENTEQADPSGGAQPVPDTNVYASEENQELKDLFFEYFKSQVTDNSYNYRDFIKNPASFDIDPPAERTFGSAGVNAGNIEEVRAELEDWISRLQAIDPDTLTEKQRFDYDTLLDNLVTSRVELDNYRLGNAFSPMRGLQGDLPTVFTDFVIENKQDLEDYIGYILLLPDYVQEALNNASENVEAGYGMEDSVLDEMISQCDDILGTDLDQHFMVVSFDDTVDGLGFLTDAEKKEYKQRNKEAVRSAFLPVYENMKNTFLSWKGKNKVKGGLCNYGENGSSLYRYLLREYTGSSKSPQEMIDYLDRKQSELKQEMMMLYVQDPDAYEYYTSHTSDLYGSFHDMAAEEVVQYFMDNCMAEFPGTEPIKFKTSYFDKSLEEVNKSTLAYYLRPAIDDPDGNLIRVNGRNTNGIWITLAHEGCPGHMYQANFYRRTDPNPIRLLGLELGYMEGWAVYSSYETLKYCDFGGEQNAEVLRRLVMVDEKLSYLLYGRVDLGIHYQGWTMEDVSNYLVSSGYSANAAEKMYNSLVGDPAVYLSYSMGYFEMQDMRDYAEAQLGDKFDVVEYHRAVLEAGPCKYEFLKRKVDKYILENK